MLWRKWKTRSKGRDWSVWYAAHHPQLRLGHLESRMRHTGHWTARQPLTADDALRLLREAIGRVDVEQIRQDADRFVRDKSSLALWSRDLFRQVAATIQLSSD